MKLVEIARNERIPGGIRGSLSVDGDLVCQTLELSWKKNTPNVSCIPAGNYGCRRRESRRFGSTFEVLNVSGRTDILFHRGNLPRHTHGCIIVGMTRGHLSGQPCVLMSRTAMKRLRKRLTGHDEFLLNIREEFDA